MEIELEGIMRGRPRFGQKNDKPVVAFIDCEVSESNADLRGKTQLVVFLYGRSANPELFDEIINSRLVDGSHLSIRGHKETNYKGQPQIVVDSPINPIKKTMSTDCAYEQTQLEGALVGADGRYCCPMCNQYV